MGTSWWAICLCMAAKNADERLQESVDRMNDAEWRNLFNSLSAEDKEDAEDYLKFKAHYEKEKL